MSIPDEHKTRHIYQFTHLDNLPDILQHGLLSYNEKERRGISHISIASSSIQDRRAVMDVSVGPGGVVHNYVPFYFCSRSPMLLSVVNAKNVDQLYLLYLGVPIDVLTLPKAVFTNASANTAVPPTFYSDPSDLVNLDWANIDSKKWGSPSDDARHARMAEALIHRRLKVSKIDHIIVWNDMVKEKVEEIYAEADIDPPAIVFDGHRGRHFYYINFYDKGGRVSIVTGPICLRNQYEAAAKEVMETRSEESPDEAMFDSIEDAVDELDDDFCALPELAEINDLPTANQEHREDVGAHTRTVVDKLRNSDLFEALSDREKVLVEFAAYLHDIGKGKSPRDDQGRQRVDADHPARAISLVQRILTEDIETIDEEEVRQIILLVAYHDLIGDILGKGRDRQQLLDVIECAEDFDMLAALNCADVESLIPEGGLARMISSHPGWLERIKAGLPDLREWTLENLEDEE
ncbi:DarT ssDNA thymidine ADP-ribosyltransferase family protein [Desulfosarcina ovata]|uniref:DarT domain-containing protein n=1 Tax=Desulfosarcina ovata subsp. ovata TaxID=2752305 RepID=A0A5K8ABI9_9BACT|nr:DarT ssDNA thymidine ADP-ribosyltransferase family protein [Desulfosarcina ovata]BBO89901.1 hypothetical protein DSCOOX_30810 [Desulfosarcina ovata subsp. ovata]